MYGREARGRVAVSTGAARSSRNWMCVIAFALIGGLGDYSVCHSWQLIDGKHWQILSPDAEDVVVTDSSENTRGLCARGMVEVEGAMKVEGSWDLGEIDALQQTTCTDWIDRTFPERCARFDGRRWPAISKGIRTQQMHFCIDRFEYPNRRGAYPWIDG